MMEKKTHKANICFDCKNAVPDNKGHGCPWSRKFEPVPGWTAEPATIRAGYVYDAVDTYSVTDCPMFDPDGQGRKIEKEYAAIAVRCVETGEVFPSIKQAGKAKGLSDAGIAFALREGRNYACGFHWEKVNV